MAEVCVKTTFLENIGKGLGAPDSAFRLIVSIFLNYPISVIHYCMLRDRSSTSQHYYFTFIGLGLACFNYGTDFRHSLTTVIIVYLILRLTGGNINSIIFVFVFTMLYLLIGYYSVLSDKYQFRWTMAQCVLTLKLIGLTFDIYDGARPEDSLSVQQKERALDKVPSFLEVAGYIYFPASFLVGPQFSMKRYLSFTSGVFEESIAANARMSRMADDFKVDIPSSWVAGFERCGLGILYLVLHKLGTTFLPSNFLLSNSYINSSFLLKLLYLAIWGKVVLYKYVAIWLLTEGSCIVIGLTYNGTTPEGIAKWDGCPNVKLKVFEGARKLGHYIESFNVNTNLWASMYIYKRLKFLGNRNISQLVTLIFLASWHGFHSGYYICFFTEFIIIKFEKDIQEVTERNPKILEFFYHNYVYPMSWTMQKVYSLVFMGYSLVPFVLFTFGKWFQVYSSLYFFGHIIFILSIGYTSLVKMTLKPKLP